MDKLPTEIFFMIFRLLTPDEAARLRLISRAFAAVGIFCIGSRITFTCTTKSLENLQNLALHPILSLNVKCLQYEATLFSSILRNVHTPEEYIFAAILGRRQLPLSSINFQDGDLIEGTIARTLSDSKNSIATDVSSEDLCSKREALLKEAFGSEATFSRRQIRGSLRIFKRIQKDQQDCVKNACNFSALDQALPKLKNLTAIRFFNNNHNLGTVAARYHLSFQKMPWFPLLEDPVNVSDDFNLMTLFNVLSFHGNGIEYVQIDSVSPVIFRRLIETKLSALTLAFSTIKTLSLCFKFAMNVSIADKDRVLQIAFMDGVLERCLGIMRQLENLHIRFSGFGEVPSLNLHWILAHHAWKNLRSVNLSEFETSKEYLTQFFGSHAKSLRSVVLSDVLLDHGVWEDVLDFMREYLKLECFQVSGQLWDNSDDASWDLTYVSPCGSSQGMWLTLGHAIALYVLHFQFDGPEGEKVDFWNPLLKPDLWFPEDDLPPCVPQSLDGSVQVIPMKRAAPLDQSTNSQD
ncbi:MAG: hypothetical protein Q9227_005679 [Pyrenula ochraceoflavens]